MTDVVDADEILRRVRRARDWAGQQEQHWRARSDAGGKSGPRDAPAAEVFAAAYEAVRKVLDEVIDPGANDLDG
ncbi:hypothetical protein [Streptomyces enissocaesilis]|uniref:Uncharacterized protein n=1 Tax=Streptomyces enissocaesilis TaxID=332589 RepID=A0ABN3X9D9_9ACTN